MFSYFINYRDFQNLSIEGIFLKLKDEGESLSRSISLLKLLNLHRSEKQLDSLKHHLSDLFGNSESSNEEIENFIGDSKVWIYFRTQIVLLLKKFPSNKEKQLSDCLFYYNNLGEVSRLYLDKPESQFQNWFSAALETLPSIIKYMTSGACILPQGFIIDDQPREEINKGHFDLSIQFNSILELEDLWKYFNAKLLYEENLELNSQNDLCRQIVRIKSRVERISHKDWYDFLDKHDIPKGNSLPPQMFLDEFEFISYLSLDRYFFTDKIQINGVEIQQFIRGFSTLRSISNARNDIEPIYISKAEFTAKLLESGINENALERVLEPMVFNKYTTHYLHSPLIRFGDGFVFLNHFTKFVNAIHSILGFVSDLQGNIQGQNNYSLSSRGFEFEKRVIKSLKKLGVEAKNLSDKHEGDLYECDVAFELNESIYLVECKTHTIPYDNHAFYSHIEKIVSDIKQFKRIADFYESTGRQFLVDKYKFELTNKEFVRILVTNVPMPQSMKVDNINLLDFSALDRFLDREPPGILVRGPAGLEKTHSTKFKDLYEGEFSSTIFKTFIKENPTANLDSIEEKTIEASICGVPVIHKKYDLIPILQYKQT